MNKLAFKNKFDIFDEDDIKQEVFILCTEGIKSYDKNKGELESYLYNFAKLRLINFRRNNFINRSLKDVEAQIVVRRPMSLDSNYIDVEEEELQVLFTQYENIINDKIISYNREIYLKWKDGVAISYQDKIKLLSSIRNIIELCPPEEID